MFKRNKNSVFQNIVTACLIIALSIFTFSFGQALRNSKEDAHNKDLKISVLIDEVGELQQRLDEKERSIAKMYEYVSKTSEDLTSIHQAVENTVEKNYSDWKNMKEELSGVNKNLTFLLKEKENIISDLALKNQNLQRELSVPKRDESILDVLIVGHNAKLTDTIVLASANPANQKMTLISIPRDLYHKGRKINELYSKYGIGELQRALEEITGVYPEKYVIFNFDSFVDLIDIMGGIKITVDKRLVDNAYPGPNHSYTVITFEPGTYQMDGKTALKYARSRKSTSDFDRASRQQQVINAVKNRVKELAVLSRLDLATKMYAKVQENLETNIHLFEALSYLQQYQNYALNTGNVVSTQNLLYSDRSGTGQSILLPRGNTYAEIKQYVADKIN